MKRLSDVLNNRGENYILPFFWQHGETEQTLRAYMRAIHDAHIGAVCCECRPHPDFCGPQWWHDMDIILDEAKKLGMKIWILDDAHFPTGQANGAMVTAPAELCKQFVNQSVLDLSGPMPDVAVDIASRAKYRSSPFDGGARMSLFGGGAPRRAFDDDSLLSVVAAEGLGKGIDSTTLINLTDKVRDGVLYWDVPAGYWRIIVTYRTRNGGGNAHYINPVSAPSCKMQIDAVYEPHWEHYHEEFGKTILGFFSDEPQLGNIAGFDTDNWMGKKMPLSWSDEVEETMRARLGDDYARLMPLLWYPDGGAGTAAYVRYTYMDSITRLVERDFSMQIGDWCAAHGVKYIGHIIEDNNQHARMGASFAHQFRGLGGQHMGGIDDIGGQVLFGGEKAFRAGGLMPTAGDPVGDGEFFHYLLGKLGASQGNVDPRKAGDTMCEIFGAYGWSEGTRLMKYLADHFMVRGVNHFVPHAFSPKAFPDPDCPPHFYAHGLNPLYRGFGVLMQYMQRVCHLISGGKHIAPIGLLYHAEAEWSGREEGYQLMQKPARVLLENQLDFDVIWTDVLEQRERFGTQLGKTLTVGSTELRALVVPYAYYITSHLARFIADAAKTGFPVVFVDALPSAICDQPGAPLPAEVLACPVVPLAKLAEHFAEQADVVPDHPFAALRYYRYRHEEDLYLFSNESAGETFCGRVRIRGNGTPKLYDAMQNRLYDADWDGSSVALTLAPYESIVVVFGAEEPTMAPVLPIGEKQTLTQPWTVSFKEALHQELGWQDPQTVEMLTNMARVKPAFSGWVRYETTFRAEGGQAVLEFENAFECVEVSVNGKNVGMRICPPYRFDLSGLLQAGENTLTVEVATTLERAVADLPVDTGNPFAMLRDSGAKAPFGLIGDAVLWVNATSGGGNADCPKPKQ